MSKTKYSSKVATLSFASAGMANFETHLNDEGEPDGIIVKRALVAYEGDFKDSEGREHKFPIERLETIVDHTNRALDTGIDIPVCQDHQKTVDNTIGIIEGRASLEKITADSLPNKKSTHLIGRMGLFMDGVVVKAKNAAEKISQGIINAVSMGLNLDPQDQRIIELSAVPVAAISGAGLFAFNLNDAPNALGSQDKSITWEQLEMSESSIEDLQEEFQDLTDKLWKILENIYQNENVEIDTIDTLKQLIFTALNGYSLRIVDLLGLGDQQASNGIPQAPQLGANETTQMNETLAQDANMNSGYAGYSMPKYSVGNFKRYRRGAEFSRDSISFSQEQLRAEFGKYRRGAKNATKKTVSTVKC
jgi:hypothetical protein